MSQKSYRVNANVNSGEKVINVNLKREINTLNILSLKINTEDTYQLHTSDYGVIVGRVLANNAFGVPNVRVSVFVALDSDDEDDSVISQEYPFKTVNSRDANNVKYNLLPNETYAGLDGTHHSIGTFPNKNQILDNDGEMEVYDKYYKYTTITNESGDYMIFGVPTGTCQVHYDCDLSDIGIISQHPYDFINKGYSASLFKSASEFLDDDLNTAIHILSQDKTVFVYPFWGDKDANKIGITRNDVNLDYEFEPSCIFMGSSITDPPGTYIGIGGMPNGDNGKFASLVTSSGDIEIIRKTVDGYVEEVKDNVTGIIDGNGVWCYSIPMNLDRIGTDETGKMVKVDDPNKGIPTRACVRFRISLTDTVDDTNGTYTAKILVPCNPKIVQGTPKKTTMSGVYSSYSATTSPMLDDEVLDSWEYYYEFGSSTPDSCFRDLYWGKVYSVKQYYPRFQYGLNKTRAKDREGQDKNNNYNCQKENNDCDYLAYPVANRKAFSCISSIDSINGYNSFPYNTMYSGAENQSDSVTRWWFYYHLTDTATSGGYPDKSLFFCFENDWINGCLYFPKVSIINENGTYQYFGELTDSNLTYERIYVGGRHCYDIEKGYLDIKHNEDKIERFKYTTTSWDAQNFTAEKVAESTQYGMSVGLLTKKYTSKGDSVFYYRCGANQANNEADIYYQLYATDIILLGNIVDIYDYLPKVYESIPSSTVTFPPMSTPETMDECGMNYSSYQYQLDAMNSQDSDLCDIFGFTWSQDTDGKYNSYPYTDNDKFKDAVHSMYRNNPKRCVIYEESLSQCGTSTSAIIDAFKFMCKRLGLFFSIQTRHVKDRLIYFFQSFVNLSRICELDVHNDTQHSSFIGDKGPSYHSVRFPLTYYTHAITGIISNEDIQTHETRSAFASMNQDITKSSYDKVLGIKKPSPQMMYLTNFDGRLHTYVQNEKLIYIKEEADASYIKFRYGTYSSNLLSDSNFCYYDGGDNVKFQSSKTDETGDDEWVKSDPLPIAKNSFYFYFGLLAGNSAIDVMKEKYAIQNSQESNTMNSGVIVVQTTNTCTNGFELCCAKVFLYPPIVSPCEYYLYEGKESVRKGEIVGNYATFDELTIDTEYTLEVIDTKNRKYYKTFFSEAQDISLGYTVNSTYNKISITDIATDLESDFIRPKELKTTAYDNVFLMSVYITSGYTLKNHYCLKFYEGVTVSGLNVFFDKKETSHNFTFFAVPQSASIPESLDGVCTKRTYSFTFEDYDVLKSLTSKYNGNSAIQLNFLKYFNDDEDKSFLKSVTNNNFLSIYNPIECGLYDFADDIGASKYTEKEQINRIGRIMSILYDTGLNRSLYSFCSSSDEYEPIVGYPNLTYYKEKNGNYHVYKIDSANSSFIEIDDNFPMIVGQNYTSPYDDAVSVDSKTLIKTKYITSYESNPAISHRGGSITPTDDAFYYVGFMNADSNLDKPYDNITPQSLRGSLFGIYGSVTNNTPGNNLIILKDIDKRFDYEYFSQTPLILPSGYDNFANLSNYAIINGSCNLILYGGIRFDLQRYGKNAFVTSYELNENGLVSGHPSDSAELLTETISDSSESTIIDKKNVHINDIKYNDEVIFSSASLNGNSELDLYVCNPSVNFGNTKIEDLNVSNSFDDFQIAISYKPSFRVVEREISEDNFDIQYNKTSSTGDVYSGTLMQSTLSFYISKEVLSESIDVNQYTFLNTTGSSISSLSNFSIGQNEDGSDKEFFNSVLNKLSREKEVCLIQMSGAKEDSKIKEYSISMNYTSYSGATGYTYDSSKYCYAYDTVNKQLAENSHLNNVYVFSLSSENRDYFGAYDFLVMPEYIFEHGNVRGSLLEQGFINRYGYAYYASQIEVDKTSYTLNDGGTIKVKLTSPLADESTGIIDYTSLTSLEKDSHVHTIGEISEYRVNQSGWTVSYNKENVTFTIDATGTRTSNLLYLYFKIKNGLKYRVNIQL